MVTLDFSAMPWIPWDMLCVCLAAGQIVHKHRDIVRLATGTCREEGHWRARWDQFYRMVEGVLWPGPAPELLLPFLDRSKAEEMEFLSVELRSMVCSCRRPVYTGAGLMTCGHCKPCRLTGVSYGGHEPSAEEAGI